MATKMVLGFTGPTRCGKGRLVRKLINMLEIQKGWSVRNGQIKVIGQDRFWRHAVTIVLPNGEERMSEEEAECHDFGAFYDSVQHALESEEVAVVIIEGFTIMQDVRVAQCCDHVFLLDVSRENTILRRSAKHAHNSNPLSVQVCEEVVWPAHERYLAHAVDILAKTGKTWRVLDANDNGIDMLDSHVQGRAEAVFDVCFPAEYMYIESCLNGLVLDIDQAVETPGAKVVMWSKGRGSNQKWQLSSEGALKSALNGFVLTVKDSKLVMWPWETGDHQTWRFTEEGFLESTLHDQGLVLDIDSAVKTPGAELVLWKKEGGPNQKWRWVAC